MSRDRVKAQEYRKARYQREKAEGKFTTEESKALHRISEKSSSSTPKGKFRYHRKSAKKRNIPFLLTFDEWWKIWQDSGHWEERGTSPQSYVMCRKFDMGAYSVDNVYIETKSQNSRENLKYRGLKLVFEALCIDCREKILCTLLN